MLKGYFILFTNVFLKLFWALGIPFQKFFLLIVMLLSLVFEKTDTLDTFSAICKDSALPPSLP